jgi:hypothetical protein
MSYQIPVILVVLFFVFVDDFLRWRRRRRLLNDVSRLVVALRSLLLQTTILG